VKESREIYRTYGAHGRNGENQWACARGYIPPPLRGSSRQLGQRCPSGTRTHTYEFMMLSL